MPLRLRRVMQFLCGMIVIVYAGMAAAGDGNSSSRQSTPKFEFVRPPAPAQDPLQDQVLDIFDNKCAYAGCHAGPNSARNLDLSEEGFMAGLVNVKSADFSRLMRVKPGDSRNSYLTRKLKGTGIKGDRMPRSSAPLSEAEIATIEKWINAMPAGVKVEAPQRTYAQAFYGWSLANLPTTETLVPGAFLYRIAHRFRANAGKATFETLFGLDGGAYMMTQVAFPIVNNLTFTVERQGINATFEFGAKWRFLREKTDGSMPLSAALYTGVDWATLSAIPDPANPATNLDLFAGERFGFFAQLPLTREVIKNRISLAFVPGVLLNGNVNLTNEDPLVTLGVGGKLAFNQKYALFAEAVPIVSGAETANTVGGSRQEGSNLVFNDTFVAGIEMKAGGHVFHIFATNSGGNLTNQYMSGGELDFGDGNFRLGFNIYRILNYPSF